MGRIKNGKEAEKQKKPASPYKIVIVSHKYPFVLDECRKEIYSTMLIYFVQNVKLILGHYA
jgi:hypothetical protein